MKCQVCGAESGKYPLCRACNQKREMGEVIKCELCGNWHYKDAPCKTVSEINSEKYLYDLRGRLISRNEAEYFKTITSAIPVDYHVFPQINLASFIDRTDNARYRNELFRNVDFLITDSEYAPKIVVEVNDQTHLERDRRERDEKVAKICEEAGIPIIKLWTSYGVQPDYIQKRISEQLAALPIKRIHHFDVQNGAAASAASDSSADAAEPSAKKGCYIATAIYGSYDCPEVRVLRRYRDSVLSSKPLGMAFIKLYYAVSPTVVKLFGSSKAFNSFWKKRLDRIVFKLQSGGISSGEYRDL